MTQWVNVFDDPSEGARLGGSQIVTLIAIVVSWVVLVVFAGTVMSRVDGDAPRSERRRG